MAYGRLGETGFLVFTVITESGSGAQDIGET